MGVRKRTKLIVLFLTPIFYLSWKGIATPTKTNLMHALPTLYIYLIAISLLLYENNGILVLNLQLTTILKKDL